MPAPCQLRAGLSCVRPSSFPSLPCAPFSRSSIHPVLFLFLDGTETLGELKYLAGISCGTGKLALAPAPSCLCKPLRCRSPRYRPPGAGPPGAGSQVQVPQVQAPRCRPPGAGLGRASPCLRGMFVFAQCPLGDSLASMLRWGEGGQGFPRALAAWAAPSALLLCGRVLPLALGEGVHPQWTWAQKK